MTDQREDERRVAYIKDHGYADWVTLERDSRDYHLTVEGGIRIQYPCTDVIVYQPPVTSIVVRA